ncbi:MAG: hypothetical protein ABIK26_01900 [Candidatus Omnitrophota bacterium]
MIYGYEAFNRYFIIFDKRITRNRFIKRAKVKKNSFSGKLMGRIYDCLTSELVDVLEEYKKFYSLEYEAFEEFLYKKYNLDNETLQLILDKLKESKSLVLYHKKEYTYGDYSLEPFILSETMIKKIEKILISER